MLARINLQCIFKKAFENIIFKSIKMIFKQYQHFMNDVNHKNVQI